jgi:monoamine oxidase
VKRVLIVGAGLSGLIAGYEPVRAGHEVTILEGQERPGGRVRTMRSPFSAGLIAEADAGSISINHDWTLAYTKRFGLTLDPFLPANLASLAVTDGRRIPLTSATRLTAEMGFTPEVEGRIHFAGEHISATPCFMQGAIESGYRAAGEVNDRDYKLVGARTAHREYSRSL